MISVQMVGFASLTFKDRYSRRKFKARLESNNEPKN